MTHRLSRQWLLVVSAGACIGTGLLSTGCGGATSEQTAIAEASSQLHGMGVGAGSSYPATVERQVQLNKLIKTLSDAAKSSNAGEASAAQALLARANIGLAEIASFRAAEIERGATSDLASIRATFDQWVSQKAVADALRAYNPTPELAKIDEKIRETEASVARATQAKQAQVTLVEQIKAKAAQAREQANNFRNQEASIRESVASASQTQRAAALEQAQSVKRQGDEYEKQAGGFDADAAAQEPEITTLDSTIQELTRQVELLRETKKALVARTEANKQHADAAAAEADEGTKEVTRLLARLDETRNSAVAPTEEALKYYATALAAAKKSSGSGAGAGKSGLSVGNIQQSIGDVIAGKARGLGVYATLLETLSKGGQPGVGPERVAAAKSAHADAVKAAMDSYTEAASDFEKAGGSSGDLKDRIEKLSKSVRDLAEPPKPPAAPPAEASAPASEPEAAGDAGATDFDAAAVTAEIKQALAEMKSDFAGGGSDPATIWKWVHTSDDGVKEFMDATLGLTAKKTALDEACKAKFGGKDLAALVSESNAASVKSNPAIGMFQQMASSSSQTLFSFEPEETDVKPTSATRATLTMSASPMPASVTKVEERWKIDLDEMFGKGPGKAMLSMAKGPIMAMGPALDGIIGKVNEGKYADADSMLLDLSKDLMAAMQKAAMPAGGK